MALIDGLVSYYKLDETSGTTAVDSHGSNHGIISGATINQEGKIGKSYLFSTSTNNVNFGNVLNFAGGANSVSFWYKTGSSLRNNNMIINKNKFNENSGWYVSMNETSGNITSESYYSSAGHGVIANFSFATNTWYHIVIVLGTTAQNSIYVNNVKLTNTSNKDATGDSSNSYPLTIGKNPEHSVYFLGKVDEVGIWSRALTSSEVEELYNSGNGLTYPFFLGYTLNLNKKGHGSEGGIITLNPDKETYDENEEVEISLSTSGPDYRFHKFEGDLSGNNNPETIIMDDDKEIDIYFQKQEKVSNSLIFNDSEFESKLITFKEKEIKECKIYSDYTEDLTFYVDNGFGYEEVTDKNHKFQNSGNSIKYKITGTGKLNWINIKY